jgi:phage baseplate assembly protein W
MSWLLPVPPNGYQGIPASEQQSQIARFYGEDIYFEIAAPDVTLGEADYVITPTGDWLTVTGEEALRQSLIRRLITNPGEWATKPNYGVGARQYVKAKNTPATRAELETRIRSQFMIDPRVASVDLVVVAQLADGSAGVKIEAHITPRGRLRSDKPMSVRLEVR